VTDLRDQRRFFAEEIQMASNVRSPRLVDALASVPREQFLPPGPWTVRGEADFQAPPRQTADADPRHVYHNIAIAIDPARLLFNGAPGLLAMAIDALGLEPGHRVLHLGTGMGYYTALIAHAIGSTGRVLGVEVDADLAASAQSQLASMPWVEVRHGDGAAPLGESFDAILINAGVTHPLDTWLDALAPGGRMILPLTATMPAMTTIGKGLLLLVTSTGDPAVFSARIVTFVAIYSAVGLRDEALNTAIGQALMKQPFPPLKALRRDAHEPAPGCWLHAPGFCWGDGVRSPEGV
jgi:protein-L-isoaspartate(D-aspartate) O-methyltransferase